MTARKTCTKCGETKPTTEFSKRAGRRDGLESSCKVCRCIAAAAYRASNPEKTKASTAKWRAANQEKVKETLANWRAANQERTKATSAAWRAANPEKVMTYRASENSKSATAAWRAANPKARRLHVHNYQARKRENGCRLSIGLADKLLKLQKGKCACGCKQPLGDNYHLDHIMPLALGGTNTDDNIQLLRSTCNQQKHAKHPIDFMQQRGFLL